jgi:four helix bundle protein
MMAYRSFEELEVWKEACQLAVDMHADLRECRDFGLRDQMTRAAVSIASNIAEGAERNSGPDFIRFLHIAKGSAAELRTQIHIAHRIGTLNADRHTTLTEDLKRISAKLQRLATSLKPKT